MKRVKYLVPLEKRNAVTKIFLDLTKKYIDEYPSDYIKWVSNRHTPIVSEEVLKKLPNEVIVEIRNLLETLKPQ